MSRVFKAQRHAAPLLAAALAASQCMAAPRLRCQLEQADKTAIVEARPGSDPYGVKGLDIGTDFRFKAVAIGQDGTVEYVKLYTYLRRDGRSRLIHQASFIAPALPAADAPVALGGSETIYAPGLGRALEYRCALVEVAP